jgi:ABC-type oligopeptide transport system substrate-binding subunit
VPWAGRRAVALLLAIAAVAAVGCTDEGAGNGQGPVVSPPTATPGPSPAATETLRWAVEDVEHIVPGDATSRDELLVVSALFEPLTRLDSTGRPQPALARSWERLDGGRRWRFSLADDARFVGQDGDQRRVTAADVAFAWNRAAAKGEADYLLRDVEGYHGVATGQASRLSGVRVVDDSTLEVHLRRPHGAFDLVVSHPSLAPLPRHRWRDNRSAMRQRPVGNGPYRMAEAVVPDRYIRVRAVDGWRGDAPAVDEILFQSMDRNSAFVAFQQDRLHVGRVPVGAVERAREAYGLAGPGGRGGGLVTDPVPDLLGLGVNVGMAPFDTPEVRRALSLAVDRRALAANDASSVHAPATSLLLPGLPAGGDGRCDYCYHDTEAAAAIFAEHDVEEMTLALDAEGGHDALVARLRQDLAAAGVTLRVKQQPFDEWIEAVRAGEAALFRLAWAPEHRTGLDMLGPLFRPAGLWNHTGVADEELTGLLDQARQAESRSMRHGRLRQAEQRALGLAAVIPLGHREQRVVVSDRVRGLRLSPLGRADLSRLDLAATQEQGVTPDGG